MLETAPQTSPPVFVSDTYRQKMLMVCTDSNDPASKIVAWSLYDGTGKYDFDASDVTDSPDSPYFSVLEAMRDGWRVMQVPSIPTGLDHHTYQLGALPYEWILEQWEIIHD